MAQEIDILSSYAVVATPLLAIASILALLRNWQCGKPAAGGTPAAGTPSVAPATALIQSPNNLKVSAQARVLADPELFGGTILSFVGADAFLFVGGVGREWRAAWRDAHRGIHSLPITSLASAAFSVEVAAWSLDSGLQWTDSMTLAAAKSANGIDVLTFGRQKRHLRAPDDLTSICAAAAAAGRLDTLQWIHATGCPWDSRTCAAAARHGHLGLIQWARLNGCPWDASVCKEAAAGGHLEVLQYLRGNGCEWDSQTALLAAYKGHFELLKWARANGAPMDEHLCAFAATEGHLEILQWARAEGAPWNWYTCVHAENCSPQVDSVRSEAILKWIHDNGCPCQHARPADPAPQA